MKDSTAVLRGAFIGSQAHVWAKDRFNRETLLSSYYLTASTLEAYLQALRLHSPQHLQAYPSSASLLSDLLSEAGETYPFQSILLGSENVYEAQKAKIAKAFPSSRIYAWYGHAEQAILAAMCEHSDAYHVWPFYGYTEVLDALNGPTPEGQIGELVGTSFWGLATPFIRYRTMDMAQVGPHG